MDYFLLKYDLALVTALEQVSARLGRPLTVVTAIGRVRGPSLGERLARRFRL